MANIVMAYIGVAYIVMAYTIGLPLPAKNEARALLAYIVMAKFWPI